jgi:hypothetical protein
MNHIKGGAAAERKLSVRFTEEEYAILALLAKSRGHPSPSAFVGHLGRVALGAERAQTSSSASLAPFASFRLDQIEQVLAGLTTQIGQLENLIRDVLDQTARIGVADQLLRSAIMQATSASYMSIQVWRLLADEGHRPSTGLPSPMLTEIQDLHRRIVAAAETKAA